MKVQAGAMIISEALGSLSRSQVVHRIYVLVIV